MRSATRLAAAIVLAIAALLVTGAGPAGAVGCGTVSVSGSDTTEGGSASFTITAEFDEPGCMTSSVDVSWSTSGGSASEGEDFQGTSGNTTLDVDAKTVDVPVATNDDDLDEPDEDFSLDANGSSASATIADNDGAPSVSISSASVTEGTGAPGSLRFDVQLSAPSGFPISVDYRTVDGSATAGSDYTARRTLEFGAGDTSDTITVPIAADAVDEPDETFAVVLGNGDHVSLDAAQAQGTIRDDDLPAPGGAPGGGTTPPPPPGGGPGGLLPPGAPGGLPNLPGQADTTPPRIVLSTPVVRNGVVQWIVTCPVTEQLCRGIVRLTTAGKVVASAAAKRKRKARRRGLGATTYTLKGGQAKKVSLKVNKRGAALVRKRKKLKVRATFTTKDTAGNRVKRSQTFTLHEVAFRHN